MYFIIKIELDEKQSYQSCEIVGHSSIEFLTLLENSVKAFVKEEFGREASEQIKIIEINSLSQVSEPLVDTILAYRIASNPNRIHLYQRKTVEVKVPGRLFGSYKTTETRFRKTHIFEVVEYSIMCNVSTSEPRKPLVTPLIPQPNHTMRFDLAAQLRKHPIFRNRSVLIDHPPVEPTKKEEPRTTNDISDKPDAGEKILVMAQKQTVISSQEIDELYQNPVISAAPTNE